MTVNAGRCASDWILANAGQALDDVDSKTVNFAAEVHAFAIEPLLTASRTTSTVLQRRSRIVAKV
jgi:hypothetical protein